MHAQELPSAPSSISSASAQVASQISANSNFFGVPSLFINAPGTIQWALFLTNLPNGNLPNAPGRTHRAGTANPFALQNETPIATSSSFVVAGFNLNAGLTHGRQNGGAPLSGFSVSTKASGMDFSLAGGVTSGNVFGPPSAGFGHLPASNTPGAGATPQLSLRLKF